MAVSIDLQILLRLRPCLMRGHRLLREQGPSTSCIVASNQELCVAQSLPLSTQMHLRAARQALITVMLLSPKYIKQHFRAGCPIQL